MTESWDAVVIGAGPAGSTTAALLAKRGLDVLVLEKEEFPRFHIGESLLPAGLPVLDEIGVEPMDETFVYKNGAQFVCEVSHVQSQFSFAEALPGSPRHAWHVERSRFDTMLRDRAVALGAEARHGETVRDVTIDDDEVRVQTRTGTVRGRFVVDASGQSRLMARRRDSAVPYRRFGAVSVFTHYDGIGDAAWEELGPGMDIRIMMRPEGWGWVIPLPGRRLSVGIVSKEKLVPEDLDKGLLAGEMVQRLTEGSERQETHVASNFSYRNARPTGRRYAAVGDAACFLDPVFSSGVTLALRGAEGIAAQLGPALEAGTEAQDDLFAAHNQSMDRAYRTFGALIDRFYNSSFGNNMFLTDASGAPLREGVMSVLAGDVWRNDNPFQDLLLKARRQGGKVEA